MTIPITRSRPFGLPRTPFDPVNGKYLMLGGYIAEIRCFDIIEILDDYLIVNDGQVVALPFLLRRTPFHGLTVEGITYAYTDIGERTATDAESNEEDQVITPSYYEGEQIVSARLSARISSGGKLMEWIDLNSAGRTWAKVEEE